MEMNDMVRYGDGEGVLGVLYIWACGFVGGRGKKDAEIGGTSNVHREGGGYDHS